MQTSHKIIVRYYTEVAQFTDLIQIAPFLLGLICVCVCVCVCVRLYFERVVMNILLVSSLVNNVSKISDVLILFFLIF